MKKKRLTRTKKKRLIIISILIAAIAVASASFVIQKDVKRFSARNPIPLTDVFIKQTDRDEVHLTAHRGFSCQAPENTLPAISKAAEYGFDSVEFDVRMTQDGVWVLLHDSTVNKTTDKRGKVESYTYYDLVTCNINRGANRKSYEKLKIPTFEQALAVCLEVNVKPVIEIKDYTENGLSDLLQIIERNGFTESCTIMSADRAALETVHSLNPEIKLTLIINKLTDKSIEECLNYPYTAVSFNADNPLNSVKKIKKLSDAGIALSAQAVNDADTMRRLHEEYGITEFITSRIYEN